MNGETQLSDSGERHTPPAIFSALDLLFDLDPRHAEGEPLPWIQARERYTLAEDGLGRTWEGLVWCDVLQAGDVAPWIRKLSEHRNGIALAPGATWATWAQDYALKADAVCFLRAPIRFVDRQGQETGDLGTGAMLVGWGRESAKALQRADLGGIVIPAGQQAEETKVKRRDYRKAEPGSFEHYILYEFPHGLDYSGIVGNEHWQIHDNRRDRLGNWQSLAGGRPDLTTKFVADLEAIPNHRFEAAVNELEQMNNLRIPGYQMVNALRYVWFADELKRQGHTRESYCDQVGMSPSDLTRYLYEGIGWVARLTFQRSSQAA